PESVTADQALKFTSLFTAAISEGEELKNDATVKVLQPLTKTREASDVVDWRGGGGCTVARLSPSCFDFDPELGLVTLTEAATGCTLIHSVAANLNFRLTPDHRYFHGVRGLMRLVVVEGRLDRDKVDDLVAHLAEDDGLTIAATETD